MSNPIADLEKKLLPKAFVPRVIVIAAFLFGLSKLLK